MDTVIRALIVFIVAAVLLWILAKLALLVGLVWLATLLLKTYLLIAAFLAILRLVGLIGRDRF